MIQYGIEILCQLITLFIHNNILIMIEEDDEQYENQSDCEDYEDYGPEGYHPVYIGQKFNNQYQVIQKLGWGHFSTVWLIKTINKQQYYALKVQRSKPSHAQTAIDEIQLLKILRKHENDPQWVKLIQSRFGITSFHVVNPREIYRPLLLIDSFTHHGMHGKHYCSVFQMMGPNLLDIIQHYEYKRLRMPLSLVKQITIDMLIGLVYLHNFCKMIHTDLKPQNIMVKLTPDEQAKIIQGLKQYKKKPLSMKYLYKIKAKNPEKNKKKYEKKKLKKKTQKQANSNELFFEHQKILKEVQNPTQNNSSLRHSNSNIIQSFTEITSVSQGVQNSLMSELNTRTSDLQQKIKFIIQQQKYQDPLKKLDQQILSQNQSYPPHKDIIEVSQTKIVQQNIQQQKIKKKKKRNKKKNKNLHNNNSNDMKLKTQEEKKINKNQDEDSQYSDDQNKAYTQEQIDNLSWKNIKIYLHQGLTFKIVDYGNATLHQKHVSDQIQTRQYRSPEVILGLDYEYNTDIWSLACVIYEMLTNSYLFKPKSDKKISKDEDHLYKMMELLGPINKNFALSGYHSKQLMNKKGELLNGNPIKFLTITELLHEDYQYSLTEAKQIESFLRPMLEYDPSKRISALDCLKAQWLWKK